MRQMTLESRGISIAEGPAPSPPSHIRKPSVVERRRARHDRLSIQATQTDRLLTLADFLPEPDRALVRAHLVAGMTLIQIAALRRVRVLIVRRKMTRLTRRMNGPEFVLAAMQVDSWPPVRAGVARLCILGGATIREAAGQLALSTFIVRRELYSVRNLAEAMSMANRVPEIVASMKRSA